tara:strand:+ start:119 stop:292 length:174 start_codon:yes stop_codon:yes gene_type:complete
MKKFIIGLSTGYLLTSLFSIPSPPQYFWYFIIGSFIVGLAIMKAWWRFNDDIYEGDF